MANNEPGYLSGRTELVAALDNLCIAMGQLVRAAESRLPSRPGREAFPATPGLNFSTVDDVPADPVSALESCASLVPVLEPEGVSLCRPEASPTLTRSPTRPGDLEERAFACRLVLLQGRLGGFLK